ncbi:MAG: dihydroneopterin aldolase [Shinella sp.]|nr:dihydroneopterin aldolase [Shinella sp.]
MKLGGSTAGQKELASWLEVLSTVTLPLIIVPGGGPFADQVRAAQQQLHFSDQAAHHMAILAMDQFGMVVADRSPRFRPARTSEEIAGILEERAVPVWLPSTMTRDAPDIPQSWDVTSDSLAAWLARRLGAARLLLIKQVDPRFPEDRLDALVDSGIVDAMLPHMLGENTSLYVAGPSSLPLPSEGLSTTQMPGSLVRGAGTARAAG